MTFPFARKKFKAKGDRSKYGKRHVPGVMNKTEAEYAALLEARKLAGEVVEWHFEAVTFKLADMCRLTVDFMVIMADGSIEFHDAKGGQPVTDDALVKMKAAAEKFWPFLFVIEQKQSRKLGGVWKRREF